MTGSTPAPQASVLLPPKRCVFSAMLKPHVPHRDASCSGIWGSGISLALLWVDVSAPAWSVVTAGCVWLRGGCTRGGRGSFVRAAPVSCLHPADTRQVCLSRRQQWQDWGWVASKSPNLIISEGFPCECWVIRTGGEQHCILETRGLVACSRQRTPSLRLPMLSLQPASHQAGDGRQTDTTDRQTVAGCCLSGACCSPSKARTWERGVRRRLSGHFFLGGGGGFFW